VIGFWMALTGAGLVWLAEVDRKKFFCLDMVVELSSFHPFYF